jgi:predicted pyridoxine 5'-phosphate oxidase superfamily flavin-nucleotide-binding protein
MSHTLSSTPTLKSFGAIASRLTQTASKPQRDRGEDPRVRRNCIDENQAAAQPWAHNQFGSTAERLATAESLVVIAEALHQENEAEFPYGTVLRMEHERASIEGELAELLCRPAADRPVGRPAALRIQLDQVTAAIEKHRLGITRLDAIIYRKMFDFLCFAGSGRWFPSQEKIAAAANCCVKSVGRAMERLAHHGLLAWISRSAVREDPDDPSKRQRVQTSHAYFLDLRKRMPNRLYQRFLQLRARRLCRMTASKRSEPHGAAAPASAPATKDVLAQRDAVSSLGAAVSGRDGHVAGV